MLGWASSDPGIWAQVVAELVGVPALLNPHRQASSPALLVHPVPQLARSRASSLYHMPLGAGSPTNPTTTLLPWQSAGPAFWSAAAGEGGAGRASLPCPCHFMLHKWQGQLSQAHTLRKPHKQASSAVLPRQHACPLPPQPSALYSLPQVLNTVKGRAS